MPLPEGQWRWVKIEPSNYGYMKDWWHLASSDSGQTFCGAGQTDTQFRKYEELGEFIPISRCMDCIGKAQKDLGLT